MAARTPTSLQSGEDYKWKNPSNHLVYQLVDVTNLLNWTSAARDDTAANSPFAIRCTASDMVAIPSTSGNTCTISIAVNGAAATGKLHIFDGKRLDPNGGTGASYVESYVEPVARRYQNKKWLTFDFPTDINTGDTWTSALRTEVYEWAWQETNGASGQMGVVAFNDTTGVFTFTVAAGDCTGRLHVWTY